MTIWYFIAVRIKYITESASSVQGAFKVFAQYLSIEYRVLSMDWL